MVYISYFVKQYIKNDVFKAIFTLTLQGNW